MMDKLIGMIIPDSTNHFFSNLAQAIQRELSPHDYALIVLSSDSSNERELINIKMLSKMNVDGLVFVSVSDSNNNFLKAEDLSIPMLILDRKVHSRKNADFLYADNGAGVKSVVDFLEVNDFKKVGIIQGSQKTEPGRVRYKKFMEYMAEKNMSINPNLVFTGDFTFSSGCTAARQILMLEEIDRPDAIFSSNDLMAVGLMQTLQEHGIRIPEDISVIGFDDIPLSSWIYPKLTTVHQNLFEMSKFGVELLVDRIHNESSKPNTGMKIVTPKLILRESCKNICLIE